MVYFQWSSLPCHQWPHGLILQSRMEVPLHHPPCLPSHCFPPYSSWSFWTCHSSLLRQPFLLIRHSWPPRPYIDNARIGIVTPRFQAPFRHLFWLVALWL